MKIIKFVTLIVLGIYLCILQKPVEAQPAVGLSPDTAALFLGTSDPAEIGSYLDCLFNKQVEQYQIAGITAVMVKHRQVVFQRGYGQSDVEKKVPVYPTDRLFRIGSVTKIFSGAVVLQLHEQGRLDLNADSLTSPIHFLNV